MRKKTAKLALRKETVKELSRKELSRAAGGTDDPANAVAQSRDKQCLAAALAGG